MTPDSLSLLARLPGWRGSRHAGARFKRGAPAFGHPLILALLALVLVTATGWTATNTPIVLYSTGFEFEEGYDPAYTLVGQNGWVGYGSGGNGLVTNFFEGQGQQAFLGFAPPTDTNTSLHLWRPLNYVPGQGRSSLVQFRVSMAIVDSANGQSDTFHWRVYNTNEARLFSFDFNNATKLMAYTLDDGGGMIATTHKFTNNLWYELTLNLDLASNAWNAVLDDRLIVSSQPITTTGAALNLGDIDAVWSLRTPNAAGDNYLVFDNYEVVASPRFVLPPQLEAVGRLPGGQFLIRLTGEPGLTYDLQTSSNLAQWTSLKRFTLSNDGAIDYLDAAAVGQERRYYRAEWVNP